MRSMPILSDIFHYSIAVLVFYKMNRAFLTLILVEILTVVK